MDYTSYMIPGLGIAPPVNLPSGQRAVVTTGPNPFAIPPVADTPVEIGWPSWMSVYQQDAAPAALTVANSVIPSPVMQSMAVPAAPAPAAVVAPAVPQAFSPGGGAVALPQGTVAVDVPVSAGFWSTPFGRMFESSFMNQYGGYAGLANQLSNQQVVNIADAQSSPAWERTYALMLGATGGDSAAAAAIANRSMLEGNPQLAAAYAARLGAADETAADRLYGQGAALAQATGTPDAADAFFEALNRAGYTYNGVTGFNAAPNGALGVTAYNGGSPVEFVMPGEVSAFAIPQRIGAGPVAVAADALAAGNTANAASAASIQNLLKAMETQAEVERQRTAAAREARLAAGSE